MNASPEKTKLISTLLGYLPGIGDVPEQSSIYWERLGIWHGQILGKQMVDEAWMASQLLKLDHTLLSVLAQWLGIDLERATMEKMANRIAALAVEHLLHGSAGGWAEMLFLLDALMHGRSHQALEEMARLLLNQEVAELLILSPLTQRSRRLTIATLIYLQNPDDLQLVVLYERSERFNYNRFVMVQDEEWINAPSQARREVPTPATEKRLQRSDGIERTTKSPKATILSKADVNQVLAAFENGPKGGRHSTCLRVLSQSMGPVMLFIYRNLQQKSINEIHRTLFGEEVEFIVLKFHRQLRSLEERSTKGIGRLIGQAIAAAQLGQPVTYINDDAQTALPALRRLLSSLRYGEDKKLILLEVHLSHAPIPGSPTLVIRGSRQQPLETTLDYLEDQGLPLLDELASLRHISLVYEAVANSRSRSNIFKIRIDECTAESVIARYLGTHASSQMCKSFETYLREEYHVTAIPAAR
ncbi:MAG: hypothetical protein AAF702_06340 [Chloroflexota bacterium]